MCIPESQLHSSQPQQVPAFNLPLLERYFQGRKSGLSSMETVFVELLK